MNGMKQNMHKIELCIPICLDKNAKKEKTKTALHSDGSV